MAKIRYSGSSFEEKLLTGSTLRCKGAGGQAVWERMVMGKRKGKKVFVGLSGGVDSSVAALLLKEEGYDVTGVFMRCFNVDGCAERDAEDARRVAEKLGIPFYVFDFEEEYKKKVVDYMVEGYRNGITPNPDIACNREIKFGLFFDRVRSLGGDFVATGHYVRIDERRGRYSLSMARDKNKDQSYFLWTLTQDVLKHCLFPLGSIEKPKVRAIAKRADLPTASKKDSQGICFLGMVDIKEFLKEYIKPVPGPIMDVSGNVLGTHDGAVFYTIGQRHGLNIGAKGKSLYGGKTPAFYVVAKDVGKNTVTVGDVESDEGWVGEVNIAEPNFISKVEPESETEVYARVRYRQPVARARLSKLNGQWKMVFKKPQRFVAVGQSIVWYNEKGTMEGGGVIV